MPPCSRSCCRGLGTSPSILLLNGPVHLSPVEISIGFACAGAGLILPQGEEGRGTHRHGVLWAAVAAAGETLTTSQAAQEGRLG